MYGDGDPTVFLLMPDSIVQSRAWKAQIPFLARSHRVVVSDPPGNGRSGTPLTVDAMEERVLIDQEWAVLDAVGAQQAVLAGVCTGAGHALLMAAEAPERVLGVCAINPGLRLTTPLPHRIAYDFDEPRATYDGWQKQNRHHWLADWRDFADVLLRPDVPRAALHQAARGLRGVGDGRGAGDDAARVRRRARDRRRPGRGRGGLPRGALPGARHHRLGRPLPAPRPRRLVAELTGGDHVVIEGGGHLPQARDPVKVNLLLRDFLRRLPRLIDPFRRE